MLTRLRPAHRESLANLLQATPEFGAEDRAVALELVDDSLAKVSSYRFWIDEARADDRSAPAVRGYICYGPTPMTNGAFDLYWIVVHPRHKGRGIGRALIRLMEDEIAAE